jgi:hypothetical protein
MPGKKSKGARKLRGAQKWIVAELESARPGVRLSTSQIAKRISKTRRKIFHKNSVYNALRLLVQRGRLRVVREGREKTYQLSDAAAAPSVPRVSSEPVRVTVAESAPLQEPLAVSVPHKLAVGEILVLAVERDEVHTATNQHGRLVLERHRRPT